MNHSHSTIKFNGPLHALHLSLVDVGYGSGAAHSGFKTSESVLEVPYPGASRLQDLQSQQRSATTQRLHPKKGLCVLRSFIGACNLYRRHIKNTTYTSSILIDLIKKSITRRWGPQEQQEFDDLKDIVANSKCFGVPKAQGKGILSACSSNVGGGGTLFHW